MNWTQIVELVVAAGVGAVSALGTSAYLRGRAPGNRSSWDKDREQKK
jgi:hypothetical protein